MKTAFNTPLGHYLSIYIASVAFLGYIIGQGEVKMDPTNVTVVTNLKQLQRFLGFAYFYRRFNRNNRRVALLLTTLTSTASNISPEASMNFSIVVAPLQYNLTHLFSLWLRYMPQTPGWEQCFLNVPHLTINSIRALTSSERNYDVGTTPYSLFCWCHVFWIADSEL